ncbi:MAG TPA: hypothetical protein VKX28_00900 [Xanthobacteraceae bacterium]|nr:hypothetical protein [Xanthobacteraceae bacterium]
MNRKMSRGRSTRAGKLGNVGEGVPSMTAHDRKQDSPPVHTLSASDPDILPFLPFMPHSYWYYEYWYRRPPRRSLIGRVRALCAEIVRSRLAARIAVESGQPTVSINSSPAE